MARKQPSRILEVYPAKDGHRWHMFYAGKVIAESGQAYKTRNSARAGARNAFRGVAYPILFRFQKYLPGQHRHVWVTEAL